MKQFRKIFVIHIVRKVISISLALLVLASMFRLSIATHYCGGNVAALKVSISGEPATCGMECQGDAPPLNSTIQNTNCCDDVLTFYAIEDNYTPSYSVLPELLQNNTQAFSSFSVLPVLSGNSLESSGRIIRPPGPLMSSIVDLAIICVFRI